jgi:glycosyltransferase involved in cell wall biosynthesis
MSGRFARARSLGVYPRFGETVAAQTKKSVSLFFPAWNEEDYVERAVQRAKEALSGLTDDWEIIIVNDASTDRTREIAEAISRRDRRVRVVSHEKNLKLGGALKTGFSEAKKDIVVYSDIDLPFDLHEVRRAIRLMEYLEADLICGYRLDRTSEGPKRIVYSYAYNLLIRGLFKVYVKDINFSFKVVRRDVLRSLSLQSEGSFIDAELVCKAARKGFRIFQIGVDYFPRSRGTSTLSSPQVIAKILAELVQLYGDVKRPSGPVIRIADTREPPAEDATPRVAP